MPFSNPKLKIAEILKNEGFILDFKKRGRKNGRIIRIGLKYLDDKMPSITGFKRISKPGQRIYKKAKEIKKVKSGYGKAIVSTSKGLMTGEEARKRKIGGEVICEVW